VLDPETSQPVPLYNAAGTAGYDTSTCEAVDDQTISEIDGETSLTLTRNEEYWGDPPILDEVVIRWITDPTQQPAALENGEADIIFPQAQVDLVNQTQNIAGITPIVDFGTFYEHMDFNFSNVHLAKQEVRQAFGLALDRQDIVTRLPGQMSDEAEVMNNHFFYPGGAAYEPNGEEMYGTQDIEGARALLEEAGYAEGADGIYAHPADGRLSVRLEWRTPNPRREQTAELVQSYMREAGIDIVFDPKPDFTFLDSGDFDIALFGWTNITVPSGHSDEFKTNGGNNNGNYTNTEVDELLAQADAELDPDARLDLLNEIDVLLWEDLPTITLFQVPEFLAYNDDFENIEQNGYDGFMFNSRAWAQAQ
jgi:peptide/nickel transport system substrate-binding protein